MLEISVEKMRGFNEWLQNRRFVQFHSGITGGSNSLLPSFSVEKILKGFNRKSFNFHSIATRLKIFFLIAFGKRSFTITLIQLVYVRDLNFFPPKPLASFWFWLPVPLSCLEELCIKRAQLPWRLSPPLLCSTIRADGISVAVGRPL